MYYKSIMKLIKGKYKSLLRTYIQFYQSYFVEMVMRNLEVILAKCWGG